MRRKGSRAGWEWQAHRELHAWCPAMLGFPPSHGKKKKPGREWISLLDIMIFSWPELDGTQPSTQAFVSNRFIELWNFQGWKRPGRCAEGWRAGGKGLSLSGGELLAKIISKLLLRAKQLFLVKSPGAPHFGGLTLLGVLLWG